MTTALALKFKIYSYPSYFPQFTSTRMNFFCSNNISYFIVHLILPFKWNDLARPYRSTFLNLFSILSFFFLFPFAVRLSVSAVLSLRRVIPFLFRSAFSLRGRALRSALRGGCTFFPIL